VQGPRKEPDSNGTNPRLGEEIRGIDMMHTLENRQKKAMAMLGLLSVAGGLLMEPGLGLFLFCLVLWLTLPWVGFVMSKQAREIQKEKGDPDIVSLIMMIILGIQGVISALIFLYVISFFLLASMAFEG